MYCKYCRSTTHDINTCTKIKCLNCEAKGHPHWKCPMSIKNTNIKKIKKNKYKKKIVEPDSPLPKPGSFTNNMPWADLCSSSDEDENFNYNEAD